MVIRVATSDTEIASCYPVMKELRQDLEEKEFTGTVRELQQTGYRLAYLDMSGQVVAVAGFRVGHNLAWKRHLYVDDLVTLSTQRSKGHGSRLLAWLVDVAATENCRQLHLDSGMQRKDAHRFYIREGLQPSGYHFVKEIDLTQVR